jgi:hypothetical protein
MLGDDEGGRRARRIAGIQVGPPPQTGGSIGFASSLSAATGKPETPDEPDHPKRGL